MKTTLCAGMNNTLTATVNNSKPIIEMRGITKVFRTGAGEFTALNKVDVCFFEGEFVSVVGKSGSGKSTLVNMLTGIDHPTSGSVQVGDVYLHRLSEGQMSIWRGRNLGIVFQFFQLLPMLSLLENVMLPMDFANLIPFQQREARAMQLLEMVGLQDQVHELPTQVAGGQQQSAAIARSLANDPPIIIADEPTGNLDSRSTDAVFEIFSNLACQGKTVIMVTHDVSLAKRTDRMMLLSDGELINSLIARAFPDLAHPRLLWLTHQMHTHQFNQNQIIPLPDHEQAAMYLIISGQVEFVTNNGYFGKHKVQLGPGEYFALPDLQVLNGAVTGLRSVAVETVEALVLNRAAFKKWMDESQHDHNRLVEAAKARVKNWRSNGQHSQQEDEQ